MDYLGVAFALEGQELRKLGVTKPILVLSYDKSQHDIAKYYDLEVSLSSELDYSEDLICHIACDTGMNRCGFKSTDRLERFLRTVRPQNIKGMYSHIFDNSSGNIAKQVVRFRDFKAVADMYLPNIITHIASSGSFASRYVSDFDMVRIGMAIYQNTVNITSTVMLNKYVKKGESTGYDGAFISPYEQNIAICNGGYADGIVRAMTGANVMIAGELYPIVGKVSMDTFFVSTGDKRYNAGDKVYILDNEYLTLDNIANQTQLTNYELMTGFKGRYEYVYFN